MGFREAFDNQYKQKYKISYSGGYSQFEDNYFSELKKKQNLKDQKYKISYSGGYSQFEDNYFSELKKQQASVPEQQIISQEDMMNKNNGLPIKGIAQSANVPDLMAAQIANAAQKKLMNGKALTSLERSALQQVGFNGSAVNQTLDLLSPNNPVNQAYRKSGLDLMKKQDSGKKLTPEETDMLETAKLWISLSKQTLQDYAGTQGNSAEALQKRAINSAVPIYNKTAFGGVLTPNGLAKSNLTRAVDRFKLYSTTGMSNYFEGIGDTVRVIGGASPEEIANRPQSKFSIASQGLKNYFNERGETANAVIQDAVTNVAQNVVPAIVSAASGGVAGGLGASSGVVSGVSRAASMAAFAPSVFGNAYKEGAQLGISDSDKVFTYALADTAAEVGLEALLGAKYTPGGGVLTGKAVSNLSSKTSSAVLKAVAKVGGNAVGEFVEEGTQGIISPLLQKYILGADVETIIDDPAGQLSAAAYDGFIGALSSAIMGGVGNVSEAVRETSIQNYGKQYNEILKMTNTDVKNVAQYYLEVSDSKALTESAKKVSSGDTSDLAVGEMLINASRDSKESSKAIFSAIGKNIKETDGGVEDVISAYEQIAEAGAIYPTEVEDLYISLKNDSENADDETVGRFFYYTQAYAPKSLVFGEVFNRISQSSGPTTDDTQQAIDGSIQTVYNDSRGDSYAGAEMDHDGEQIWGENRSPGGQNGVLFERTEGATRTSRESRRRDGLGLIRMGESRGRDLTAQEAERLKNTAVVDDTGAPKRLYHYTPNMEFTEFAKGDIGFHFGTEEQALARGREKSGRVMEVFLAIQNPYRIPMDLNSWQPAQLAARAYGDEVISNEEFLSIRDLQLNSGGDYDSPAAVALRRILAEKGYDGIEYENMFEGDGKSYIAFYPEQIIIMDDGISEADQNGSAFSLDKMQNNDENVWNEYSEEAIQKINNRGTRKYLTGEMQRYVRDVAKSFGRQVVFEDIAKTQGYSGGQVPDAYIDENGTIHVGFSVVDPINFILKHELTHFGERSEDYQDFVETVKKSNVYAKWLDSKYPGNDSTPAKAAKYREDKMKNYAKSGVDLSVSEADAELIADFVGEALFTDGGSGMEALVKSANKKERPKIIQFILDFIQYLKEKLKGNRSITLELLNLERKYAQMLNDAEGAESQKNTAGKVGIKSSISGKYDYSKSFEEQIDDWKKGLIPKRDSLVVSGTPEVYQKIGFTALPMTINQEHVDYALNGTKDTDHKLGEKLLKQLPEKLKTPVAVFKSETQPDRVVALLDFTQNGKQIIAPVEIDGYSRQNNIRIDSNAITSVFGKNNAITKLLRNALLDEARGKTSLYYWNKKVAVSLLQRAGLQLPGGLPQDGYIHSISDKNSNVNKRLSSQTETQQFKRWFGKSKVVDENGKPLIVYHGTDADFNVFNSTDGVYWFSQSQDYAEAMAEERGGNRIIKAYLSIRNPYYAAIAPGQFSDPNFEAPIIRKAKSEGYDGVIIESTTNNKLAYDKFYVVFDPSQIKSATDNIGTFDSDNPDIRFSIPDDQAELLDRYDRGEISREEYLNLSNANWVKAIEENGKMPGTGDSEEEVVFPSSVDGQKKVRRFVRTIVRDGKLTDRMIEEIGSEVLLGNFSYDVISDDSSQKYADKAIKDGQAERKWNKVLDKSKAITKKDIAIGEKLLVQAINQKDTKRVLELSSELSNILTGAGQLVQAAKMLKQMSGIGKLMYVRRFVDSLNNDLEKKYKRKAKTVQINEKIAQQLAESKPGEDVESIYQDALQDIASQVPSTFLDKWNAWRYMSMLVNPTTHIRNLIGNVVFIPAVRNKDFISAVLEHIFLDEKDRTKSIIIKKEYKDFAEKDSKTPEAKKLLKNNKKYDEAKLSEYRKIFNNKMLESIRKTNSNLLEAEDMIFKNRHYQHALAGYLQARKVNLKTISYDTLKAARKYAVNEALKATFNDNNAVSKLLISLANQSVGWDIVISGPLAFKRTPINVLRRGVEYSPIGLLSTLVKGAVDLKKGKFNATEFIDGLGAGISGSVLLALGMLLRSLGWVTGGFGDDDEDKFKKLNGEQEYALQLFGKSYTIDWAAPSSIPFFIGVETMDALLKDNDSFQLSDITDSMWNALEPITNLSMLSGLQDMIDSVKWSAQNRSLLAMGGSIIESYLSQGIPSIFGKVARTVDSERKTSYVDKNSQLSEFTQGLLNTAKSKLPIDIRPEYVNAWGETESTGNLPIRVFSNFLSPGYYSEIEYDAVDSEIQRLAEETGEDSVYPKSASKYFSVNGETKYLTADEYVTYAKRKGQYSYQYVDELLDNKAYQKLTDAERVKVIENLYKYANAKAKAEISEYDITESFGKVYNLEQSGVSPVMYYISRVID